MFRRFVTAEPLGQPRRVNASPGFFAFIRRIHRVADLVIMSRIILLAH
jgi:hypothetical protein